MTHKFPTRPKLSNIKRHDRFVAVTQQIGALGDVKNFEKAFQKAFKSGFEKKAICARRATEHPIYAGTTVPAGLN